MRADLAVLDHRVDPPGSQRWETVRRSGIGGSEVAAALGLADYLTPWELFYRKTGGLPPLADSEPMYWGRALEAPIAQRWADDNPQCRVDDPKVTARHAEHAWVLASPDRLVDDDGLLEIKTAGLRVADRWEGGAVPDGYAVQAQWLMHVWGRRWCDIVVLIGGQDYRCIRFEYSATLAARIVERAAAFWQLVCDRTPPAPSWSDRVADLWPTDAEHVEPYELDDYAYGAAREAARLAVRVRQLDREIVGCKNIVRAAMGDHPEAVYGDKLVATWRSNSNGVRVFRLLEAA